MRVMALLGLVALLVGCGKSLTPEEKARADARDVAFVEKAQKQHAPAQPITLEGIPPAEQAIIPPTGKGCVFVPREDPNGDPIGLFGSVTGHIRVDGKVLMLAPDTGSRKIVGDAWSKYVGKTHLIRLTAGEAGGGAWIEVLDPYDRKVYFAPGELRCAAAPTENRK
jgi:hypothetical protein